MHMADTLLCGKPYLPAHACMHVIPQEKRSRRGCGDKLRARARPADPAPQAARRCRRWQRYQMRQLLHVEEHAGSPGLPQKKVLLMGDPRIFIVAEGDKVVA